MELEFLLALKKNHPYDRNIESSDCYLKISDVVVIVLVETLQQLSWRKVRVIELYTDNDDFIRSASVKVYQKSSDKTFIMKQLLHHLVLLQTTVKKPANESQRSSREAAIISDTICKLKK